ncbi:chromosome-associated kinesin KIF4-like isoform X4 [Erpetoichthys calabaricus]|uniref:chromosome-associated kinesin KIF4-like isoform X4 n=1 Tax=Erpetoichthys calabaricus TaxID=27687 RepID=UPI0022341A9A|nr:chromosome-associated kinesin KIF4-like isoform X4 [Erpetoichthys calabaricus]
MAEMKKKYEKKLVSAKVKTTKLENSITRERNIHSGRQRLLFKIKKEMAEMKNEYEKKLESAKVKTTKLENSLTQERNINSGMQTLIFKIKKEMAEMKNKYEKKLVSAKVKTTKWKNSLTQEKKINSGRRRLILKIQKEMAEMKKRHQDKDQEIEKMKELSEQNQKLIEENDVYKQEIVGVKAKLSEVSEKLYKGEMDRTKEATQSDTGAEGKLKVLFHLRGNWISCKCEMQHAFRLCYMSFAYTVHSIQSW